MLLHVLLIGRLVVTVRALEKSLASVLSPVVLEAVTPIGSVGTLVTLEFLKSGMLG